MQNNNIKFQFFLHALRINAVGSQIKEKFDNYSEILKTSEVFLALLDKFFHQKSTRKKVPGSPKNTSECTSFFTWIRQEFQLRQKSDWTNLKC